MNEKDLHTMCNPSRNNKVKSEKYDSTEKKKSEKYDNTIQFGTK